MLFPRRLTISRDRFTHSASRSRRSRQRNQRAAGTLTGAVWCGPMVEQLESRQMLSAQGVAQSVVVPTLVVVGRVSPGTTPANSPQTSATAPYTPLQVETAYGDNNILFNGVTGNGAGQTIAIVDAYNNPDIITDTATFDTRFGLPQFNVTGGPTLKVLNQTGAASPLPQNTSSATGDWDVEEALDVQWAHAMAPEANIILFEANTSSTADMYPAEATAAGFAGVSVVSNSWASGEGSGENAADSIFTTPAGHQGVTFLASTGDNGTPAGYPSFSPNVVAVGGTSLQIQQNGTYISESAWSGTGGGISQFESLPGFQSNLNGANGASTTFRNVPDVAADADPNTGVFVLDNWNEGSPGGGYFQVGGTSLACPLWAGMIAVANQGRVLAGKGTLDGPSQTLPTLYSLPPVDFNDVTTGGNGTYNAGPGYDLVTGIGTPQANLLIPALAGYSQTVAPTITAPPTAGLQENGSFTFSAATNTAITVGDFSAGSNPDSLMLTVSHGTLTLASTTGLNFTSGTNGTSSFTVSGSISSLNAALSGLTYQPASGYVGQDSLLASITDPGDSLSASASVTISIVPPVSTAWTAMTHSLPSGDAGQLTLLLPNGQLFVHGGGGSGPSAAWYLVTPDSTGNYVNGTWATAASMNVGRLYFGSVVLPNGKVFVVGGEYSSIGSDTNTAEIYDPVANKWSNVAADPQTNVGDEPAELLPDGNVLVGNIGNSGTEIYDPATNTWSTGAAKAHSDDVSDEEPWVKLGNGDILTYDIFSSINANKFIAELYNPSTNQWSDVSSNTLPILTSPNQGFELGPALLLPDGRALFTGATGLTAFFDPTTDTWTQGPTMPTRLINGVPTQLTMGDAPGAVLPNGDVLLALSPAVTTNPQLTYPPPTYIYDFNPSAGVFTDVSPSATLDPNLPSQNSFVNTMLVLPTGQVLLTDDNTQLAIYSPDGSPQEAWRPTITSFTKNSDGSYTLTGTQLNGLDEGAAYGDDNQMAENYPIVQVTDTTNGHVYYATTSNWSSYGVATGSTPETVNVVMPAALGSDAFSLEVIADGIASNPLSQAPIIAAPSSASVNQNSILNFINNLSITVSDGQGTAEKMTLTVGHGTLNFGSATNLNVVGNGSAIVTVTGALSDLNNALTTLSYTPTLGYNGPDTLTLSDMDTVDSLSETVKVSITVNPLAPSITATSPLAVPLNGTLAFTGANQISVTDPSGTNEQMTLTVSHGTLNLTTTGLTATGTGTASVTLSGPLATLNSDLATLVYAPANGYTGGDTLSLSVKDTTDNLSTSTSVAITVESAPIVSAPSAKQSVTENSSLSFSPLSGNGITVADIFASGNTDSLTVSVTSGTVTLSTFTGLQLVSGADGSKTFTVSGTLDSLNAALNGLVYQPSANLYGSDSVVVTLSNPGDGLIGSSSVAVTINALAPKIAGPGAATLKENGSLTFSTSNSNAISIADINTGGDQLSISVGHGTLTLSTTLGLNFTTGNNGTSSFVVTGSLTALTTALNGLIYQPAPNYSGPDSLAASIQNLVDTKSASTSISLTIDAVPAINAPSSASVTENSALNFSSANGNEITLTDQSAGANPDVLTISVSNGTVTLGSTTGLTITSGINGSSAFTVTGTLGNLNAGVDGLAYQPGSNYVGSDTLAFSLTDPATSLGGTSSVGLTVNAIAPPTVGAPPSASVAENGTLVFSSANNNAISITDNAAGISADSLKMTVSHGTLTLASTNGLIVTSGSNGTASFTVQGSFSNLATALGSVTYQPTANYVGPDSLAISLANPKDGLSGSASVPLTVSALAPSITAPQSASVTENASLVFSGGNLISLADANPSAVDSLTLTVAHGAVTLSTTAGLNFSTGNNGQASFTVTGTVTNLNSALSGLTYQPTTGYFGPDSLAISILDPGDNLPAAAKVTLTVNPLAAPSITAPISASLVQNSSLVFSTANNNAISIFDATAGSSPDSLTLSVAHGTLTLSSTSGLSFTTNTNGSASFTVSGTVTNLNAALAGLVYRPTANYTGPDSLAISVTDSVDSETASTSVALNVTTFSPPSVTAPTSGSLVVNGSLVFSSANKNAIAVADSGPGNGADTMTLTVTHGTITLASTSGLSITGGANGSASVQVVGSIANLNAALNGLTYKPNSGYTGTDSLSVSITDTAKGDSLSGFASVALNINVSAPAITAPATAVVAINSSLVFSGANKNAISIADTNAGNAVEPLTLTAINGTLSLGSTAGITFTSGSNDSLSMTINGTLANLNAALAGLTFAPAKIGSGTVVLSYTDLGTGMVGTATVNITIIKGGTKLGGGGGTTGESSGPQPAVRGGSVNTPSASLSGGNGTTDDASMPPDALTQYQGLSAAVEILAG
jgi:Kelch motif